MGLMKFWKLYKQAHIFAILYLAYYLKMLAQLLNAMEFLSSGLECAEQWKINHKHDQNCVKLSNVDIFVLLLSKKSVKL